jgi:hypothetical protein
MPAALRKAATKAFVTEMALCERFLAGVDRQLWTPYAETGGWDILLVRNADGFQIGIQAKLRLNAEVITQAMEKGDSYQAEHPGPDCRAVLVPHGSGAGFGVIATALGITLIAVRAPDERYDRSHVIFWPPLPRAGADDYAHWPEHAPAKRHPLPPYVPDVPAGSKSPVQLTAWKVKAIKLAITLEHRGYVTRKDFSHLSMDYRRWITPQVGWLRVENGRYVKGPRLPDFQAQHPMVWEQIKAEAPQWMVRLEHIEATAKQGRLL